MTAESLERIESLQNLLDSTLETFDSAKKLLDINEQLLKSVNSSENAPSSSELQQVKRISSLIHLRLIKLKGIKRLGE